MPSQKKRIALTVDDDIDEVLENLSKLLGKPKTKVITGLLRDLMPMLSELNNSLVHVQNVQSAIPVLMQWTAFANSQVSVMNSEMADLMQSCVDGDMK